ncbi:MAG: hypothetical protein ACLFQK_04740 [Fibrobacterota bacterium]
MPAARKKKHKYSLSYLKANVPGSLEELLEVLNENPRDSVSVEAASVSELEGMGINILAGLKAEMEKTGRKPLIDLKETEINDFFQKIGLVPLLGDNVK